MFRKIRIAILLLILLSVALTAWRASVRAHEWGIGQTIGLYPVNADGSAATAAYLKTLDEDSFRPIQKYMTEEMRRHGIEMPYALSLQLGPEIGKLPPPIPEQASWWQVVRWSLELRWWAWRNTPKTVLVPKVRLYLLYHGAGQTALDSAGLAKGRIGLVNLFADKRMEGSNLVVATHEMLHTFGATDKYDPASLQPLDPQGLAEPERVPRYPQQWAEIMAGRIALGSESAEIPRALDQTLIGPDTAHEIGWDKQGAE